MKTPQNLSLDHYRLLGRSGLRVSPLCLGTMAFGTQWGWGADEKELRRIFDKYADEGGNFIDTANGYNDGELEEFLGRFLKGQRDRFVVATKFSANMDAEDPNAGGNHRKNIRRSVEELLKRLGTDYIDLYWLHAWENRTPWEEIMSTLDALVCEGKINYVGVSDTPAWQIARANEMASLRGWAPFIGLQIEYSLIQRTVERDLIPMALEMGLGVTPWSPLAGGVLSGKYSRADVPSEHGKQHGHNNKKAAHKKATAKSTAEISSKEGRKEMVQAMGMLSPRGLDIADAVKTVAAENGVTPVQVAIRWLLEQPGVCSPIIGPRTLKHLEDNLGALDVELSDDQLAFLDRASAVELGFPHDFLRNDMVRRFIDGDAVIDQPANQQLLDEHFARNIAEAAE